VLTFAAIKVKMDQMQELSQILGMHRKAAKLSRVQLAELAGVGKTVVFDIEKGKESVQLDTLRKILKVLNIKIILKSPLMDNLQNSENEKS
jgi:transcriptional regulator with XRE-family HTH domain